MRAAQNSARLELNTLSFYAIAQIFAVLQLQSEVAVLASAHAGRARGLR
jgi:hypothetical protein